MIVNHAKNRVSAKSDRFFPIALGRVKVTIAIETQETEELIGTRVGGLQRHGPLKQTHRFLLILPDIICIDGRV